MNASWGRRVKKGQKGYWVAGPDGEGVSDRQEPNPSSANVSLSIFDKMFFNRVSFLFLHFYKAYVLCYFVFICWTIDSTMWSVCHDWKSRLEAVFVPEHAKLYHENVKRHVKRHACVWFRTVFVHENASLYHENVKRQVKRHSREGFCTDCSGIRRYCSEMRRVMYEDEKCIYKYTHRLM